MKIKSIFCKLTLLSTMSLFSAQAATYYVATTGSDSNPGTAAQPFRTISYAYSLAGPGTTILVAPGTYTDYQSGWGIHLGSSGTASSPIVLQSQVRGAAIIDGQNASDRNEGIYIDGSYNVVDGFEIKNGPNGGIAIFQGSGGNGNQILNCEIDHNGNPASTSTDGHSGVYDDQDLSGNVWAGNYIHDNGRVGGSNLDHGMYLCGQNDVVVNNVVVRNDSTGLQIAGYTTVSNMKVYNNVFAWNGVDGIIVWMNVNGVDIKNNILYNNGNWGIHFYAATGSGVVIDHNLNYGNVAGNNDDPSTGGGTVSATFGTTISAAPLFANETQSSFDAHLNAGSPAIGAGYNFYSTFTTDLTGAARPSSGAWDLGAYVYGSSSSGGGSPPTPPTVSITSPTSGATVKGTVSLSANASDKVSVSSVQFKLDGANLVSALTASPYTLSWNSLTVANGTHTLSAVATDPAGLQTTAKVTITVNNPAPTVTMTSPAGGASYSAPATINLAASVTANGHTINQVQFYNGNTLLGTATTSPYSIAWANVGAATYGIDAVATYDGGSTVASPQITVNVTNVTVSASGSSLTFPATSGTISAPFSVDSNNAIEQPAYTALSASGQAVYTVNIPAAGHYVINAVVQAPSFNNNSFWVNFDAQPTDPTMVWDVPVTTTFAPETVSWRGNGTVSSSSPSGLTAQYSPKVFNLSAGTHKLIIRGREGLTQLQTITIAPTTLPAN